MFRVSKTWGGSTLTWAMGMATMIGLASPAIAANCESDADCDDGLYCNGPETCVLGECENAIPPCDEDVACHEGEDRCLNPGEEPPSDDDTDGSFECSYLGGGERFPVDLDTFTFQGMEDEGVTVVLASDEEGATGEARLMLRGRNPETGERWRVIEQGDLPLTISATLPWSGEFRIVVRERKGTRRHPLESFNGAYCVDLFASSETEDTLAPATNVEPGDQP